MAVLISFYIILITSNREVSRIDRVAMFQQYNGWVESALESSLRAMVNRAPKKYDEKFREGDSFFLLFNMMITF